MRQAEQIPRYALGWIMLSQLLLVAPHATRLPVWVLLLYLVTFSWRLQIFRSRWSAPPRWQKLLLISVAMAGIGSSYGTLIGLEPTVALLLAAFALKLVESVSRYDAYVLIFLGFFICITEFLFTQDLLIVLYSALVVWVLVTALVAVHRQSERFDMAPFRLAGTMLLQAVPLMIVLFFLFPRIGPLWTVPIKSHTAKTGVSDVMRPGDIANLTQSTAVAFRASFDAEVPAASELYWRGLVLSVLDDDTWRSVAYYEMPPSQRRPAPVEREGQPIDYSVIIEPTQQNWLYSLRYAESAQAGIMELPDYRLYSPVAIENELRYRVRSWPLTTLETALDPWRRRLETRLPDGSNPESRALAEALRRAVDSDSAYVDRVLRLFREQPFRYTLQPPLLGPDPVDEFLLSTRAGFCEHYAAAFAVLMRAVDIPARVVTGYQGGEVNPVNGTVIVHQFDAHAWNEVWLPERGWVRVDPTGAVSPERIEFGLESALAEEGSFLSASPLSPLRFRGVQWINSMRLRYDALTYRWQSWVVGFDGEQQYALLEDWFGAVDARRFIALTLGTFAVVMMGVAGSLLLHGRARSTLEIRVYKDLVRRLEARGVSMNPGETPSQYIGRASAAFPGSANALRSLGEQLEMALYSPAVMSKKERKLLRDALRQVRLRRR